MHLYICLVVYLFTHLNFLLRRRYPDELFVIVAIAHVIEFAYPYPITTPFLIPTRVQSIGLFSEVWLSVLGFTGY